MIEHKPVILDYRFIGLRKRSLDINFGIGGDMATDSFSIKHWRIFCAALLILLPAQIADANEPLISFRDCAECPEMMMLPSGTFVMGSPDHEDDRDDDEGPQHEVTFNTPFSIGKYEVTKREFAHFVTSTGYDAGDCRGNVHSREDPEFIRSSNQPIICISWHDARAYCDWLAEHTEFPYHLPSEAMWEYAARAGTTAAFAFGDKVTTDQANFRFPGPLDQDYPAEVGTHQSNGWGIHDMHGNVWEWTEDVYHEDYHGAPVDGSAWIDPPAIGG